MRNGIIPARQVGFQTEVQFLNGSPPIKAAVTTNLHGNSVFNGVTNPNWRTQVANHEDATTPADAVYYTSKVTLGSLKVRRTFLPLDSLSTINSFRGISPIGIGTPSFDGPALERARNLAIEKLYRFLGSPASVGEDIAEWKQTVQTLDSARTSLAMLADSLSRTNLALLSAARAKNWNDAKKLAKSLADLTLLYRLGVKPVIGTVKSVYEVLRQGPFFGYDPFNVQGFVPNGGSNTRFSQSATADLIYDVDVQVVRSARHRFKGERKWTWDETGANLRNLVGLTWRDAIPTLYNLIPYSFLVDYVTNLGTVIDAISVPWDKVAWCCSTSRIECRSEYVGSNLRMQPANQNYRVVPLATKYPRASVYGTSFIRTKQTSLPVPSLQLEWPSASNLEVVLSLVTSRLPIIRNLTSRGLNSTQAPALVLGFNNQVRDRSLRVPYPFHRRPLS